MSTPTPGVRKVAGFQTDDQRVFLEEEDARRHANFLRFVKWFNENWGEVQDATDLISELKALRKEGFITFAEGWEP